MDAVVAKIDKEWFFNSGIIKLVHEDNGGTVKKNYPPLKGKKCLAYEGGVRVPLMIKWKNKAAVVDTMVSAVDFFPTLVDLSGSTLPKDQLLDGTSILPLITGTGTIKNRAIFRHQPIQDRPMSCSVIFNNYKLILFYETPNSRTYKGYGKYELYNLKDDLAEKVNLVSNLNLGKKNFTKQIKDPVVRKRFVTMAKMLNKWLVDNKADLPYTRDKKGNMTKKTIQLPKIR